ncbi:hypothetical protein EBZ80_02370 [bacterium]|nr:hypothetical protein [bacterium]
MGIDDSIKRIIVSCVNDKTRILYKPGDHEAYIRLMETLDRTIGDLESMERAIENIKTACERESTKKKAWENVLNALRSIEIRRTRVIDWFMIHKALYKILYTLGTLPLETPLLPGATAEYQDLYGMIHTDLEGLNRIAGALSQPIPKKKDVVKIITELGKYLGDEVIEFDRPNITQLYALRYSSGTEDEKRASLFRNYFFEHLDLLFPDFKKSILEVLSGRENFGKIPLGIVLKAIDMDPERLNLPDAVISFLPQFKTNKPLYHRIVRLLISSQRVFLSVMNHLRSLVYSARKWHQFLRLCVSDIQPPTPPVLSDFFPMIDQSRFERLYDSILVFLFIAFTLYGLILELELDLSMINTGLLNKELVINGWLLAEEMIGVEAFPPLPRQRQDDPSQRQLQKKKQEAQKIYHELLQQYSRQRQKPIVPKQTKPVLGNRQQQQAKQQEAPALVALFQQLQQPEQPDPQELLRAVSVSHEVSSTENKIRHNRGSAEKILKGALAWIMERANNHHFIFLVDAQNLLWTIYGEVSFYRRKKLLEGFLRDPDRAKAFLRDALGRLYPRLTEALEALEASRTLTVVVNQGDISDATELHAWSDNLLEVSLPCVDPGTKKDCFVSGDFENPMDDYAILLLRRVLEDLSAEWEKQKHRTLRRHRDRIVALHRQVGRYPSQDFQQVLTRISDLQKQARQAERERNPYPVVLDLSFDLRRGWNSAAVF